MDYKQRDDEAARRILSRVTRYSSDWSEVMTKTLGQVAYEALVIGYGENVDAKEWPGLSQATHDAWQDAADAVVNRYIVVRSTADRKMLDDKEQAVIEAAKALEASLDHPEKDYQGVLKVALAVRALQEVEQ